jgi:bifunctional DNase/RNase
MGEHEAGSIASVLPKPADGGVPLGSGPQESGIYDLLAEVLHAFDIACERVVVDLLHGSIFYALASFHRGKTVKRIDMRPSDAIALALRDRAPVLVHEDVVDRASMTAKAYKAWQEESRLTPEERKMRRLADGRVERPYPLRMGGTVRFSIRSRRKFGWESGDPSVATVTADGTARGLKAGRVALTATWEGRSGGRSARPRRARRKGEG